MLYTLYPLFIGSIPFFFRWCRIFYSTSDRSTSCTDVISVGEPRCRRRTRKLRWRRCEAQSAAVLLSAAGERDWKPRSKGSLAHSPWKTATCDTWIRLNDSIKLIHWIKWRLITSVVFQKDDFGCILAPACPGMVLDASLGFGAAIPSRQRGPQQNAQATATGGLHEVTLTK